MSRSTPPRTYRVDLVYGGGVLKQRYMTRVPDGDGFYYAMLPLQFQHEGSEAFSDRTRKVWRDYNAQYWFNETTQQFTVPARSRSFEKNCMSCHASTSRISGSDATRWTAEVVSDPLWGDFDYDGDGVANEMNLGCESCHGPGSAHWEAVGQGKHIVSPQLLTPSREAMICGQCHSRPKGALGTDSPVNAAGWMMVAGTSRRDFLRDYATTQLDAAASDLYANDPGRHSKSHHQQYTDFIRSGMYKNSTVLMTCSSCHDPHQRGAGGVKHQLRADPTDNAALCGGCHAPQATNLSGHIDTKLGPGLGLVMSNATCVQCHMPKTAKTGAGRLGILAQGTQYWTNDISSHLFDMPRKDLSRAATANMPTAYTDACGGVCHAAGP